MHPPVIGPGLLGVLIALLASECLPASGPRPVVAPGGPAPSADRLDRLKAVVLGHQARLTSLRATMRSWHAGKPQTLVSCVVAAKGRSRYESLWHGLREDDRAHDPGSITRYYDGVFFNVFGHYDRRYEVTKRFAVRPYLEKLQGLTLFECLGWWPPGDPAPPLRMGGEPMFLVDIFADPRIRILPKQKSTGGHACAVVEIPSVLQLWIDPRLGVVRRWVWMESAEASRVGRRIFATYQLSDFRRYEGGIWLPHRITREFPMRDITTIHIIDSYDVNHIRDELFEFEPPPGSLVYNRDTDTFRQVPGGLDALEAVVRRAASETALNSWKNKYKKNIYNILFSLLDGIGISALAGRMRNRVQSQAVAPARPGTRPGIVPRMPCRPLSEKGRSGE